MLAQLQRGEHGHQRFEWARERVTEHGPLLILAARFVPGGRVASGLATGSMSFPWRRFVVLDAIGASLWAGYSALIGYLGGASFTDDPVKGLMLAAVLAVGMVALIEIGRRLRARLRSRRGPRATDRSDGNPRDSAPLGGRQGGAGDRGADVSEMDSAAAGLAPGQSPVLRDVRDRGPER
jgi:hypothetical protein